MGGVSRSAESQRYALIGAQSMLHLLLQSGGQLSHSPIASLCPDENIDHLVTQVRSHLDRALAELQLLSVACAFDSEEVGETQLGRVDISSGNYYKKVLQQCTKLIQQFAELT
jgi:hypothetical protein